MKRILFLTAALVAAFTANAFADFGDEGNNTTEPAVVTVSIPGIFNLSVTGGSADATFTVTEAQVLAGSTLTSTPGGNLNVVSNYNGNVLTVGRDPWAPVGTGDGNFTLKTKGFGSGTYNITISDVAPVSMGSWSNGTNVVANAISYELSGISVADDPDTYTTNVTYTLSHT